MRPLFRKSLALLLSLTMIFVSGAVQIFAQEADATNLSESTVPINTSESTGSGLGTSRYSPELIAAYQQLCTYFSNNSIPASISLETFAAEFDSGTYSSLNEYLQFLYLQFSGSTQNNSRSSSDFWYFNTDGCTVMPDYSRYNLLSIVQPGDILYEAAGGFGITGHIAIVEGIHFDSNYGTFYISVIEAIAYISGNGDADGVCKGVLDDDRLDQQQGTILRVSGATSTQITRAVSFCRGEIGANYVLDLDLQHDTASGASDWYCSELVWAAYYNQGIDLETNDTTPLSITPHELLNSSKTATQIITSNLGVPTITSIAMTSQTTANIYWSAIDGAISYSLYRSTNTPTSNTTPIVTTANTYCDSGLDANTTYYYWVVVNINSSSGSRSPIKAIKTAYTYPLTIFAYASSNTSATLSWTQVYNAAKYEVHRATSAYGTYTKISTVTTTSYTDSGLNAGTTYYYKVISVNSLGSTVTTSNYRSIAVGIMKKPKIYNIKDDGASEIRIKWTKIPEATTYYIYIAIGDSEEYTLLGSTSRTDYTAQSLDSGVTYRFRVCAINTGNTGGMSSVGELSNSVSHIINS